jgi:RNA polymerase sigma factor (sigma-70 family)
MPKNKDEYLLSIIEKCRLGKSKKKEWEELYKYSFPQIYLFLKVAQLKFGFFESITGLEDVVQDVFVKLIKKFPDKQFQSLEKFNNYLSVVSKNHLIDTKRQAKYREYEIPLDDYENFLSITDKLYQNKVYEIKESKKLLRKGIKKLPYNCRKILIPLLVKELTLAEIARRYEIPEGSIYTQYRRCVNKLKKILKNM